MHRRTMLGVLGGATAGLAVLAKNGAQAGDDDKAKALADCSCKCVEACSNAMNWCNETFLHATRQAASGKKSYEKVAALWLDCGEVCGTSAKLVARMSPLMIVMCQACAEGCDACVSEAEKLGDAKMKDATAALRACSKSCREMLQTLGVKTAAVLKTDRGQGGEACCPAGEVCEKCAAKK